MLDFTKQNKFSVKSKIDVMERLTEDDGQEKGPEIKLSKNKKLIIDRFCDSYLDKLEAVVP